MPLDLCAYALSLQLLQQVGHVSRSHVPLLDRQCPFMEDIVITKDGVTKGLKTLGPDKLRLRVLKDLATELDPFLPIVN